MILDMNDIRTNVAARVAVVDDTIVPDILNEEATHDNLIRALDILTAPVEKGAGDGSPSLGRHGLITALHRDHHDDGDLGPHGHNPHGAPGWACDFGAFDGIDVGDNPKTRGVVKELIAHNKYVTKVGTIGAIANDPEMQALADEHNTLLFEDEGTGPHVHIQSA